MYWRAIGTSVDRVVSITYRCKRVYGRPIVPLGEVWQHPPPAEIQRFRLLSGACGATGASWWDWQGASGRDWRAVGAPLVEPFPVFAAYGYPPLGPRARGDLAVWAQQRLRTGGVPVTVDGVFGAGTQRAVRAFQALEGLPAGGAVGPRTWEALLRLAPAEVAWRAQGASAAALGGRRGPRSASLPATRSELDRGGGGWAGPTSTGRRAAPPRSDTPRLNTSPAPPAAAMDPSRPKSPKPAPT